MTTPHRPNPKFRAALTGYLFISPWLIGFLVFTAGPLLVSLWYSFTDLTVFKGGSWIGLENYARMVDDPLVGVALWNTLFYTALFVPLVNVLALGIAAMLSGAGKHFSFSRMIYFLPSLMGAVVVAVVWRYLFGTNYGLVNAGLELFGLARIDWLGDPLWTKPALVIMNLWAFGDSTGAARIVGRGAIGRRIAVCALAVYRDPVDQPRAVFQSRRQHHWHAANFYARVYFFVEFVGNRGTRKFAALLCVVSVSKRVSRKI